MGQDSLCYLVLILPEQIAIYHTLTGISHHLTAKAREKRATTSLRSIASARRTVKYASARQPSPASQLRTFHAFSLATW